ncbi:MAG TPA: cyclic dehypoxanthinyl futalosine synthase [Roseiflexaceae bacterium]|nr:cyclic dehypoxanthinyl futalosine synthase [Roseiflexaceae bacterium]
MTLRTTDYLLDKAAAGERLSFDDGLLLYREADLLQLGLAANAARQLRVPGRIVTYLVDRNINYTNVCTTDCSFCGFYRRPGHAEAYVRTHAELGEKIQQLVDVDGTRVLMQGGHHPDLKLDWYVDLLQFMRANYPSIEIDAFSPSEIENFTEVFGMSTREVLQALMAAGLSGLPGGGGEILDDEIRARVSPKKQKTDGWLGVMREAQALGLATSATMVIGFGEELEHRLRHLLRLRELQDESLAAHGNGFTAFISWTVQHSEMTSLGRSRHRETYGATPYEYLRHAAISRLMLDNVAHHQASWVTQGPKIGQVSLEFGIDDFGSTMLEENVVSSAAHDTYACMSEGDIHALVRDAGYIPAKRDTRYELLRVFEDPTDSPAPAPIQHRARERRQRAEADVIALKPSLN